MLSISKPKLIALAAVIVSAAAVWTFTSADETLADLPLVRDQTGNIAPAGFALIERVTLGGIEQTILIRTQDTSLPVMLFLHGGLGGALIPWVDFFHTPVLEENFTVVH
jgi:hypothetical protein